MDDFYAEIQRRFGSESSPVKMDAAKFQAMQREFERDALRYVLARVGNYSRAAEILGLNRNTVMRRCWRHGIPTRRNKRDREEW